MEITALDSTTFDQPPSVTQPSSSAAQHGGICLSFEEAVKTLPKCLRHEGEHERDELAFFLSHIDEIHKPDGPSVSAKSVLNADRIIEAATGADGAASWYDFLDFDHSVDETCGRVASEIATKVINGVDSHNITLSVLNILQRFAWETKAAMTARTFLLTFGDNGLNLCAQSKLSFDGMPTFKRPLLEITRSIVEFQKLPKSFWTSKNHICERTNFIVAIYWVVRATMVISASHIMAISSRGNRDSVAMSSAWPEKFEAINNHLRPTLFELKKLLEDIVAIEAYKRIQEITRREDHRDNIEVLNVLLSRKDYHTPQLLYCGLSRKKVHLDELKHKHVLLFLSCMEFSYEIDLIDKFIDNEEENVQLKCVWIPIIDDRSTELQPKDYDILKHRSWYSVDNPLMMKNEVIKFIKEDWNFEGEAMVVVLDPQGKVVNHNAINMMLIWGKLAYPFTNAREETLWEQQTWDLELFDHNIQRHVTEWIKEDMYIFVCGGEDTNWIRMFRMMVQKVANEWKVHMAMYYVGRTNSMNCSEKLVMWYFWSRLESMIYSMAKVGKFDAIFQEIQRLHNRVNSNVEWAIIAKGSTILVNGLGQVALSTLDECEQWKEKAFKEGFGMGFKSHYKKLYQKKIPFQRMEFPTAALQSTDKAPKTMVCPDCHCRMKEYTSYVCKHPPSRS